MPLKKLVSATKANQMFDNVYGHKSVLEQIKKIATSSATAHAFLFIGPTGVGKRKIALELARQLLKKETKNNEINIDSLIDNGTHPDLHTVNLEEGKKQIPVESIRKLCNSLQLKPYYPGPAVAIIDNAHKLGIGACNAFLKTLEEPPGHAYIFLITDSPQILPETIVSRCQLVHFSDLKENEILKIIEKTIPSEKELAAKLSKMSPHSLELLEIENFINPRTLKVDDEKALLSHLQDFGNNYELIQKKVDLILKEDEKNIRAAKAAAIISEICSDKEKIFLSCSVLKSSIRKIMIAESSREQTIDAAKLLTKLVEAEQLIKQRTLNPQLKLASIFC